MKRSYPPSDLDQTRTKVARLWKLASRRCYLGGSSMAAAVALQRLATLLPSQADAQAAPSRRDRRAPIQY